jgi:hypothetical protein
MASTLRALEAQAITLGDEPRRDERLDTVRARPSPLRSLESGEQGPKAVPDGRAVSAGAERPAAVNAAVAPASQPEEPAHARGRRWPYVLLALVVLAAVAVVAWSVAVR